MAAENPFLLLLSEAYNDQWRVFVSPNGPISFPQSLFAKTINDSNHIRLNAWANGWFIDEIGRYTITIEYFPQNLFYLGLIVLALNVSALGIVGAITLFRHRTGTNRLMP